MHKDAIKVLQFVRARLRYAVTALQRTDPNLVAAEWQLTSALAAVPHLQAIRDAIAAALPPKVEP